MAPIRPGRPRPARPLPSRNLTNPHLRPGLRFPSMRRDRRPPSRCQRPRLRSKTRRTRKGGSPHHRARMSGAGMTPHLHLHVNKTLCLEVQFHSDHSGRRHQRRSSWRWSKHPVREGTRSTARPRARGAARAGRPAHPSRRCRRPPHCPPARAQALRAQALRAQALTLAPALCELPAPSASSRRAPPARSVRLPQLQHPPARRLVAMKLVRPHPHLRRLHRQPPLSLPRDPIARWPSPRRTPMKRTGTRLAGKTSPR